MVQDVYIDLLFLINFSMDYICLFICSRVLHRKPSFSRVLIASAIGGAYSVISLFLPISGWIELTVDSGIGSAMCFIVYYKKKQGISALFLTSFLFIGISMMMGGCMSALFNILNKLDLPIESIESDSLSTYIFAVLALGACLISLKSGRIISRKAAASECKLYVKLGGNEICFSGLIDSGNLVRDPISGRTVIFLDRATIEEKLSLEFIDNYIKGHFNGAPPFRDIRLISIHTASGSSLAAAFSPEKLQAELDSKRGRTVSIELDALISPIDLADSRGYTAIVPAEIIKQ